MSIIDNALSISAAGKRLTSGASTASTTLPLTSSGTVPRYVRIFCEGTGSANIKLGPSAVVAAITDTLVNANEACVLVTNGSTYIAYIQSAAASIINVMPVEY